MGTDENSAQGLAIANATAETLRVRNLFKEIQHQVKLTPVFYCDNAGATYVTADPIFHSHMKHLTLDYYFVRKNIQSGEL